MRGEGGAVLVPVLALGEARQFRDMFNATLWQKVTRKGGGLFRGGRACCRCVGAGAGAAGWDKEDA